MSKEIYRKAALERLEATDQLDKLLKITTPMSWFALLGSTLIIVFALVWSFTGSLPSTVTASGVIVGSRTSTNTFLSPSSGTVEVLVREGSPVEIGAPAIQITVDGASSEYLSDQRGYVSEILVDSGATVKQNAEIFRVFPYMSKEQKQVVVCYVPINDVDKIDRGMNATITLTSADSAIYGHMLGRVINIDSWATSIKGIEAVVGMDNALSSSLTKEGSVCAVTCELVPSDDGASSVSGYYWSNAKGNQLDIKDRMMCTVKIITKEERPITKLFTKLGDILNGKR